MTHAQTATLPDAPFMFSRTSTRPAALLTATAVAALLSTGEDLHACARLWRSGRLD